MENFEGTKNELEQLQESIASCVENIKNYSIEDDQFWFDNAEDNLNLIKEMIENGENLLESAMYESSIMKINDLIKNCGKTSKEDLMKGLDGLLG